MSTAYISSFVYCKHIEDSNYDDNIHILPFLNINLFHDSYPLHAVCSIFGDNIFNDNIVRAYFKAPDNSILIQYNWTFDETMLENANGNIPDAIVLNLSLNSYFNHIGTYSTEIFFNEERIGIFYINVIER